LAARRWNRPPPGNRKEVLMQINLTDERFSGHVYLRGGKRNAVYYLRYRKSKHPKIIGYDGPTGAYVVAGNRTPAKRPRRDGGTR
jgi:hypothetical protein